MRLPKIRHTRKCTLCVVEYSERAEASLLTDTHQLFGAHGHCMELEHLREPHLGHRLPAYGIMVNFKSGSRRWAKSLESLDTRVIEEYG